ncbi:RlmI/RlmK family 23S rRNA methyltransferase, partial [Bacillus anthracis]|nr:RlmI/RlmK family 23S rRNA methyltransferase [Bacillus anthracis]
MRSEVTVKIKPKFIKEIKSGYPLILKDAIQNLNDVQEEGTIIKV